MKRFAEQHPVWFALWLARFMTILGIAIVIGGRPLGLSQDVLTIAVLAFSASVPLHLIRQWGWWEEAGFVSTTHSTSALAIPAVGTLFALMWFRVVANEACMVPYFLLVMFLVGLGEEALSRGLLMRAFLPKGNGRQSSFRLCYLASAIFPNSWAMTRRCSTTSPRW